MGEMKLSLWTKLKLYFRPWIVSSDVGSNDCMVFMYAKHLDGVTYILKEVFKESQAKGDERT